MSKDTRVEIRRGLREVYIDRTKASFIDGKVGKLLYRGYNIDDLAEHSTFEETSYLLFHGDLPNQAQLTDFEKTLRASRHAPEQVIEVVRLTSASHPMDALRTAISASAAFDPDASDISVESTLRKGIRLTALAPTLVAAHARIAEGLEPVEPRDDLGHAANFLYMLFGSEPDPQDAAIIDKDFVLHAEHGINASSFAARVAASTKADIHCAITAGIAVLKGPSHGGAAEGVMKMALEIGSEDRVKQYVADRLGRKEVIVGFGHRVYHTEDPRARHLKGDAKRLSERRGDPRWFAIISALVEQMAPYARRGIAQNVDLWSGAIYQMLGIKESLYIPIFAMGRIPGWTAQVIEQLENNILLRPRLQYVGEMDREYLPLERR